MIVEKAKSIGPVAATKKRFRQPMSKRFRFPGLLLLALLLNLCWTASDAQDQSGSDAPSAACLAFKNGLTLGATLAHTRAKLKAGEPLTIVALGSSSTTGFGTFGHGGAFPDVMKEELSRLRSSGRIELINSGRIMEDLADNISRIDADVLRYKPDLLVWQIGTNDVVWRGIADNAKEMLSDSVRRLKTAKIDVVLLDLQYAPLVLATTRYIRMEKIIEDVADEQKVGYFPRFLMMKRAIEGGVTGLVSWDGLHNSAEGYKCVGLALAQMIDAAAR
ncbi:MAG: SGNH/GDSL hydrolase family protein [Xanthobacteraceae bacterium]|nr:SGNH/GDSL hydrolase family protein [Xanthobacteraceae bacterium]